MDVVDEAIGKLYETAKEILLTNVTAGFRRSKIIWFLSNGFFTRAWNLWQDDKEDFLSYDELRNNPDITYTTLKERFDGFDDNFFKALMELKELD